MPLASCPTPMRLPSLLLSLLLLLPRPAHTQPAPVEAEPPPLFRDTAPLELTLTFDVPALLRDRSQEARERPATVTYRTPEGDAVTLNAQVRTRGNFRLRPGTCDFPPIRLNLKKGEVLGTLFAEQDKLKLVTHCRSHDDGAEDRVALEQLAYALYAALTPMSYRTRLARITYVDADGRRPPLTRLAFFIEDTDALAARHGGAVSSPRGLTQRQIDLDGATRMALFQYLIGNTDWAVPALHNLRLVFTDATAPPTPVPYDFDFSGWVDAPYAEPVPQLGLASVRERLYRGPCRTETELAPFLDAFEQQRLALYGHLEAAPLSETARRRTRAYLDEFFDALASNRRVRRTFIGSCLE